jgi:hypothetical protein
MPGTSTAVCEVPPGLADHKRLVARATRSVPPALQLPAAAHDTRQVYGTTSIHPADKEWRHYVTAASVV